MRNLLMAVATAGAMAVATSAFGQATVFIDEGGCVGFDGEGNAPMEFADVQKQQVLSDDGHAKLSCHGTNTGAPPPGRGAVLHDAESTGLDCQTGWGLTSDWHQVVTPSGQTTIVCQLDLDE